MRLLWMAVIAVMVSGAVAPAARADEAPKVRAVMFWDQACPNCEDVLRNVLPEVEARYGPRFQLVLAEVSALRANDAYFAAIDHFQLPEDRQGVPLLVLGEQVLLGREEIAAGLAPAIDAALAGGGADLPAALSLTAADIAALEAYSRDLLASADIADPAARRTNPTDSLAYWLAIAVLLFMLLSLALVVALAWRARGRLRASTAWPAPSVWVAGLALAGLAVAGYLSYVKLSGSDTVCPIGRCEAVQHSPYASLLGVPVSHLGFLAYLLILGLWAWGRRRPGRWPGLLLAAVSVFGTAFSAYLTFLEPFVIEAVCVWCLVSAVLITGVMLLAVRPLVAAPGPDTGRLAASPA